MLLSSHSHKYESLDAARFGQQGSITRMWAVKGTRALGQQQFEYTYLFEAVCPSRGTEGD